MKVENILKPLSVRVSWEVVEEAERYTITFTKAKGIYQEGLCQHGSHTASLSVDALNATIHVGSDVEFHVPTTLRAYTTYHITVVAESDKLCSSRSNDNISLTTPQTGEFINA